MEIGIVFHLCCVRYLYDVAKSYVGHLPDNSYSDDTVAHLRHRVYGAYHTAFCLVRGYPDATMAVAGLNHHSTVDICGNNPDTAMDVGR